MGVESRNFVICSAPDSRQLSEFRKWVEAEWGEVDPFEDARAGDSLPSPILAIANSELVGGLSFTYSTVPDTDELALWINTLLVATESRGVGIGSNLVEGAQVVSAEIGITRLYVYTSIPSFYQRLGWTVFKEVGQSMILTRILGV